MTAAAMSVGTVKGLSFLNEAETKKTLDRISSAALEKGVLFPLARGTNKFWLSKCLSGKRWEKRHWVLHRNIIREKDYQDC